MVKLCMCHNRGHAHGHADMHHAQGILPKSEKSLARRAVPVCGLRDATGDADTADGETAAFDIERAGAGAGEPERSFSQRRGRAESESF